MDDYFTENKQLSSNQTVNTNKQGSQDSRLLTDEKSNEQRISFSSRWRRYVNSIFLMDVYQHECILFGYDCHYFSIT